jgi:hypothetical protein
MGDVVTAHLAAADRSTWDWGADLAMIGER